MKNMFTNKVQLLKETRAIVDARISELMTNSAFF